MGAEEYRRTEGLAAKRDGSHRSWRAALRWSVAPAAIFAATASPAAAQDACVEPNPGEFVCEDNGAGATTTQDLDSSEVNTTVDIEDGFTVDTSGGAGDGMNVYAYGGVAVTQAGENGSIIGADNGLAVTGGTYYAGDVSIEVSGDVVGQGATGVYAYGGGLATALDVDTAGASVSGETYGVAAYNNGTGALNIETADVSGAQNSGIYASNYGTDLAIDSSAGEVSGGTYGVYASNNGSGALSITTANVDGAQNAGIYATNAGTDLDIDTSAGAVSGETYGIYAFNNGTGSMEVTTGDVTGNQGAGVYAVNNGNGLDLDTSGGAVSGGTYGVYAFNQAGDMNITTGDVSGAQNGGVSAVNRGGDMNVDTSAGAVSGETYGISAFQRGTGALNITTGDVEGRQSAGIIAQVAGPVPINATLNGDTAGATIGMDVTAFGSDVSVTNNGALSGGDFAFRSADADTGDVTFDNNGAVNGAVRFGTGDDSLTNEGTVQGDIAFRDGANVLTNNDTVNGAVSFGSGDDTVTNTGTLTGDLALGSGINSVSNTGSITGSVTSGAGADSFTNDGAFASDGSDFGDGDDTFANNGTFDASGDVGFGGGADSFDNAGDLNVDGAVAFSGLETLTSGGSIAMNNGTAGDTLTTSGDFVGAGGTLDLDVDFGSNTADQLIVEGAATGTTEIRITDVGLTGAQGQPLVLVDGGAGTSETAFALAGDQAVFTPFISQGLSFDAANNDVLLSNTVSSRVFEAAALAETAQSLWYRSADAWADQRASERGDDSSRGVWAVAYGGTVDRENDYQDQTGQGIGNATLDYDQDYIGIQAGIDLVSDETVGIGLTAGYLNSNSTLDASSVETEFDVYNVGGYASYQRGGLSAEALIKYDSISGRVSDPIAAGYNGDLDGEAYGARLALAYRTAGAVYVEPHVSIEWQQTDLDSLAIDGQVFDFGSIDGLRGIAGVRVGGNFGSSGAMNFGYYAGASAVHEFEGDGNVRFSVGSDGTTFANDPIGTYALIEGGVTVDGEGPLSALIHLESELSGDYTGFGGKIGGKIRF